MLGNHPLKSFAKAPGGSRCRGTLHGQYPPSLPSLIPVCPGLDTQRVRTHRTRTGSNSWCQQEETQELLGAFALAQSESHQGNTSDSFQGPRGAASTAHTKEQHLPVSILPCWETASAASGLLFFPSLAPSPAASETHKHGRATSHIHQPQVVIPRNGMSCGLVASTHSDTSRAGGMESRRWRVANTSPSPFVFWIQSFPVGPLLFPPHSPGRDTVVQLGSTAGMAPA